MNTHHNTIRCFLRGAMGVALLSSLTSGTLATDIVNETKEEPTLGKSGFLKTTEDALTKIGYDLTFNPVKEQMDTQDDVSFPGYLGRYKASNKHHNGFIRIVFENLLSTSNLFQGLSFKSNEELKTGKLAPVTLPTGDISLQLDGEEKPISLTERQKAQIKILEDFIKLKHKQIQEFAKEGSKVLEQPINTLKMLATEQIKNQTLVTLYFLMVQNALQDNFLKGVNSLIQKCQELQKLETTLVEYNLKDTSQYNLKEKEEFIKLQNIAKESSKKTFLLMETEFNSLQEFYTDSVTILSVPGSVQYTLIEQVKNLWEHKRVKGNRQILMPLIEAKHVTTAYKTLTDALQAADDSTDKADFKVWHTYIFGKEYTTPQ
jgi:hypothetical protein